MKVAAAVVARDGVDVLAPLHGEPMVAHAVRALLATGLVHHVRLLGAADRTDALLRACVGLPISAGARVCSTTSGSSATQATAASPEHGHTVVLLHDAARPLAPPELAVAVVDAVRSGHRMAVPVLPLSDTVKRVDEEGVVRATPDRAGLRVLQTPIAVRADVLTGVVADVRDPLEPVRRHLAAGGTVHTVAGHPAAFAVQCEWDLELAELLARRTIQL